MWGIEPIALKFTVAGDWIAACEKDDYVTVTLYDTKAAADQNGEGEYIRLRRLQDLLQLIAVVAKPTNATMLLITEFARPLSNATYTAIMTRLVPSFHDVTFEPVAGFAYPPIPPGPLAPSRVESVSYGRRSDVTPSVLVEFEARLKDAKDACTSM